MENPYTLGSIIFASLLLYFLYLKYRDRNDGDYTVIHQKVTEDEKDCLDCSIDLLHTHSGKLLKNLKVSWKHQVLCTNPAYCVRIKKGVLYLFKKGNPSYAQKEEYILLEREGVK